MINLYDLLDASNGQLFGEPRAHVFTEFCIDARQARENSLYVVLRSERGDGHRYMEEAVANGATGLLCTRPPEFDTEHLSVVLVRDTLSALMAWSHDQLGRMGVQVVGVAGHTGKRTTLSAIETALQTHYRVLRSAAGVSGKLVVPLTLARLGPEHQIVLIELDPAPGEMPALVGAVRPHVGVVTSVGEDADGFFSSPAERAEEYRHLLEYLSPVGLAVLNYDDDRARALMTATRARVMTVGVNTFGADILAQNVKLDLARTGFDLRMGETRLLGKWTPLLGTRQLYAVLVALALAAYYEIPPAEALRALTNMQAQPGIMKPLAGLGGSLLIDNSYRATTENTLAALDWLHEVRSSAGRALVVLGDMDTEGEETLRSHRLVGQRAAQVADLLVTEGSLAAISARAAIDHGLDAARVRATYSLHDASTALREAGLTRDDVVLLLGGRNARLELLTRGLLIDPEDEQLLPRPHLLDQRSGPMQRGRPAWVEIDLDAVAHNVRAIRARLAEDVTLFAVVKADAYGHGAIAVARTALLNGASYLAVANIEEALALRSSGIDSPILLLTYLPPDLTRQALRENLTVTLYDLELARAYDREAREAGGRLRAHIKIDTGMGRLGVLPEEGVSFARHLLKLNHLEIEGIYTHFAMADEDSDFTAQQIERFEAVLKPLQAAGIPFRYVHTCNSAGLLAFPHAHYNAVRAGIILYGLSPSPFVPVPASFRPVMAWKTVIASIKTLPPGWMVGYGGTYETADHERIAVLPVGYADGYRRVAGGARHVLVHGQFAPIVGRVSMEKITINVSHIPDVSIGDEVVLLGQQGDAHIDADDLARQWGTTAYELVCSIMPRVRRA
jgi:alanine racemase